jgi:hypothetical protein
MINLQSVKYSVMQIRCFTNLIERQIQSVKGENIPDDPEWIETLHTLAYALCKKAEELDNLTSDVKLPSMKEESRT